MPTSSPRHLALLALLILVGCDPAGVRAGGGGGSDPRAQIIDGNPLCAGCEVRLRPVALLGDASDPSSVREDAAGRECMVGRLSTGEYVMSGAVGGGSIFVYGPDGTLVRTIGRRGGGPGELGSQVRLVVGASDTLYVLDEDHGRVQVLTDSGRFVRSFPAPGWSRSFALLADGSLLLHRSPTHADDPLFHLVRSSGEAIARFGGPSLRELDLETWIASPGRSGGFWTASIWRYEIFRWAAPDSLEKTLIRDAAWFPPDGDFPDDVYGSTPPPAFLDHVWEDGAGRVWTYSRIPDPAWEPGIEMRPMMDWFRRTFDTVIEVIDLEQGRLVARGEYDGKLGIVCGSHLMYTVVEAEDGDTRVQVLEPVLVGPGGKVSTAAGT